ncbi:SH3 domain-containing protein [Bacillus massiliglaciei]
MIIPSFCFAVLSTIAFEESISAATPASTQQQATSVKYVHVSKGSSLNVRSNASTTGTIIGKLSNDEKVIVYSESNGWSQIQINGKKGYVSSNYLTSKTTSATTKTKYVNVSTGSLNMRKSGSTSAAIVANLKKGTAVTVYSESNGWAKVKANGKDGYVSTKYLSASKSGSKATQASVAKPAATAKTTTKYVNVSSGSLNMRKSGSTSAAIVPECSQQCLNNWNNHWETF